MISANTVMRHCRDADELTGKERAHAYMLQRQAEHKPVESIEEIRRQLGWDLLKTKH